MWLGVEKRNSWNVFSIREYGRVYVTSKEKMFIRKYRDKVKRAG